ncbi:MAG: DCC1-like thiol-disulfide oxidoreductase family protein [Cyanobacteria bacterium P01_C01_bin.73]
MYCVIYDGNCNLCTTLVQALERIDGGDRFQYAPMQDAETLAQYSITPEDCELGMILLNTERPEQRWQGSDAAEEIGRLLPAGAVFINLYRSLPGVKSAGDRVYEQVRDNRYRWFGKRSRTYQSAHPICTEDACAKSSEA